MNSVRYYFALALAMYTQKYVLRASTASSPLGAAGLYDPQIGTADHSGIYCDRSLVPDPDEKVALCGWDPADLIPDLWTGDLSESYLLSFIPITRIPCSTTDSYPM